VQIALRQQFLFDAGFHAFAKQGAIGQMVLIVVAIAIAIVPERPERRQYNSNFSPESTKLSGASLNYLRDRTSDHFSRHRL
jgi:hypothetical protein